MSDDFDIKARLAFVGMDADKRVTLRAMRPLIARALPLVLDQFYLLVARSPEARRMFKDAQQMRQARDMQVRHWDVIAQAEFGEAYANSVRRVGETHSKLGLEPRWYIGGCNFILSGLIRAIELSGSLQPSKQKKARMMDALITAALLDMDIAISVYLAAGRREKEALARGVDAALDTFRVSSKEILAAVNRDAGQMRDTATGMSGVAASASQQSAAAARAAQDTSGNVQTVAAAAEQLGGSIHEIGRQVGAATQAVRAAGATTERSTSEIEGLSAAGQRIGAVVDLIQAIAAQTNLLALNATIEAARAGEAGRGFAVVAAEVKNLAAQTARATEEIAQQVHGIQTSTRSAVDAVKEIASAMQQIDAVTTSIASAVERQGAATQEITRNVQRAAAGTQTLSGNLATVNGAIDETGRSAQQVLNAAVNVVAQAERMAREVEAFFVRLRTGPMDRRKADDPGYRGEERRQDRSGQRAAVA